MRESEIVEVFPRLIKPEDIDYEVRTENEAFFEDTREEFSEIIETHRENLGLSGIKGIDLSPDQVNRLRGSLHNDTQWISELTKFAMHFGLGVEGIVSSEHVNIPWWCETTTNLIGYNFHDGRLYVESEEANSYATQLLRNGVLEPYQFDSASICGDLITADGKKILGLRRGHHENGTLMVVPAGSLEGEIFETFYQELEEELKLSLEDLAEEPGIIGTVFDWAGSMNTVFVVRGEVKMTFGEVEEKWRQASDRAEHEKLLGLGDYRDGATIEKMLYQEPRLLQLAKASLSAGNQFDKQFHKSYKR